MRITITGTTAGSAICSQSGESEDDKRALVRLDGYQNASTTPQICAFPVPFSKPPFVAVNIEPEASVSTIAITLPASMSGPVSGWIILEGY